MSDSAALEQRYRRLLAWFPAEHRRTYGLDGTAIAAVVALATCPWLLRRGNHLAVGLISGTAVLLGLVATVSVDVGLPQFTEIQVGFTAFYLLELLAVAILPDPGRGWRVLTGKPRWPWVSRSS